MQSSRQKIALCEEAPFEKPFAARRTTLSSVLHSPRQPDQTPSRSCQRTRKQTNNDSVDPPVWISRIEWDRHRPAIIMWLNCWQTLIPKYKIGCRISLPRISSFLSGCWSEDSPFRLYILFSLPANRSLKCASNLVIKYYFPSLNMFWRYKTILLVSSKLRWVSLRKSALNFLLVVFSVIHRLHVLVMFFALVWLPLRLSMRYWRFVVWFSTKNILHSQVGSMLLY